MVLTHVVVPIFCCYTCITKNIMYSCMNSKSVVVHSVLSLEGGHICALHRYRGLAFTYILILLNSRTPKPWTPGPTTVIRIVSSIPEQFLCICGFSIEIACIKHVLIVRMLDYRIGSCNFLSKVPSQHFFPPPDPYKSMYVGLCLDSPPTIWFGPILWFRYTCSCGPTRCRPPAAARRPSASSPWAMWTP